MSATTSLSRAVSGRGLVGRFVGVVAGRGDEVPKAPLCKGEGVRVAQHCREHSQGSPRLADHLDQVEQGFVVLPDHFGHLGQEFLGTSWCLDDLDRAGVAVPLGMRAHCGEGSSPQVAGHFGPSVGRRRRLLPFVACLAYDCGQQRAAETRVIVETVG